MPFRKTSLKGPMWTSVGRAKLSPRQHRLIAEVLAMCCFMYNALLESWQSQYQWWKRDHQYDGVKLSDVYDKGEIRGDVLTLNAQFSEYREIEPEHDGLRWADLSYLIGRGVIARFDRARQSFFDRVKARREGKRIKPGYPRFKPSAQWKTMEISAPPAGMVKPPTEGGKWWTLHIKGLGVIKFLPHDAERLYTELALGGRIQEIRITVTALRTEVHLAVRTVTPDPEQPEMPSDMVGIDLGVTKRATLSDGTAFDGVTEDRTEIVKRQRALSKHDERHKKHKTPKYTPGRKRKVKALAKAHARVATRERNSIHRLVHEIITMCVEGNRDGIAAELLQIQNMMKNRRLADRIQQQRWGMFLRLLEVKAERAGIRFVQVNPRHTSLECSRCKNRKPKAELPLSVRIYECGNCGLVLDRDVNAAINILIRGFGQLNLNVTGGEKSASVDARCLVRPRHKAGAPTGRTSDTNQIDSASYGEHSDEALVDEGQAKQYASVRDTGI